MPLRRLVIASCLLVAGACKQDDPPATAAAASPEVVRKQDCERFATDMARTGLVAGQVIVTALDDDPESASRGRAEMKAGAQQLRRELFDKCMQWPEEVMQCLPPLGILKDGCEERLIEAMDGATPAPENVPAGPAPAWSFVLDGEPRHVAVASDGTVLALAQGLVGVRDGKIAWRKHGDFAEWLLPLPGEPSTWVGGIEDRVVAFDPASGTERWSATLPAVEDDEGLDEPADEPDQAGSADELHASGTSADVRVAALHGDGLLVGDAEARFFRVDPRRCGPAPGAKATERDAPGACVTADGRLSDEILESDARLFVAGNDERLLWETGVLRAFSGEPSRWRTLVTARAHDVLSHVAVAEGRLVLIVDHDVVDLDPSQCRGEAPFAPSDWPQPGALVVRGADECDECRAPPPGCRRWRTYLDEVTGEAPALLDDGTVVVHAEGYTLALRDGQVRWKVSTGGGGPLVTDGTRVLGFSTGLREGDPPGVFEVAAADGTLRWHTALPLDGGELYFSDGIALALRGGWLVAAYEQTIVALPLPPA
jgi:outer membrane protein assembly factor BamB